MLVGRIAALSSRIKRVSLHSRRGAPVFIDAIFLLSRTTTLETFSRGSVMILDIYFFGPGVNFENAMPIITEPRENVLSVVVLDSKNIASMKTGAPRLL